MRKCKFITDDTFVLIFKSNEIYYYKIDPDDHFLTHRIYKSQDEESYIISSTLQNFNKHFIDISKDRKNKLTKIMNKNLIPDNIVKAFYNRILDKLNLGHDIEDAVIQIEINRIISLNGEIPDIIKTLLNTKK